MAPFLFKNHKRKIIRKILHIKKDLRNIATNYKV